MSRSSIDYGDLVVAGLHVLCGCGTDCATWPHAQPKGAKHGLCQRLLIKKQPKNFSLL